MEEWRVCRRSIACPSNIHRILIEYARESLEHPPSIYRSSILGEGGCSQGDCTNSPSRCGLHSGLLLIGLSVAILAQDHKHFASGHFALVSSHGTSAGSQTRPESQSRPRCADKVPLHQWRHGPGWSISMVPCRIPWGRKQVDQVKNNACSLSKHLGTQSEEAKKPPSKKKPK